MTSIEDRVPAPASDGAQLNPTSDSAWRLLAVAAGWVVLAFASTLAVGFVTGIIKGALQLQDGPTFRFLLAPLGVCGFSTVLIVAATTQARALYGDDARAGLADAPVARLPIIIILAIAPLAYGLLADYARYKIRPDLFFQSSSVPPWLVFLNLLIAVFLAPFAEELFFRGWLWTGLRRRWDTLPTALVTAGFWLALHLERGIAAAVALLPLAIILSLVRQAGKSIRATIPVHAIYNLAVDLPLVLIVLGLIQHAEPAASSSKLGSGVVVPSTVPTPWMAPAPSTTTVPSPNPTPSAAAAPSPTPTSPGASTSIPAASANTATALKRDVFTGSESQISALNYVNPDCSSDLVPEVRVVMPPANGKVRFQEMQIPIQRPPADPLSRCNGKPMDAVSVFYKSNAGFIGIDTIMVDVDFRHGVVRRFIYTVSVR